MNWPTELPASGPVANVHRSQKPPEYCTNLLARIGTVGWSAVVSYGESAWTELELGAKPESGSPLGALQGMGLIGFEQLPAGSARTVSVLYLTKAGRRQLMEGGSASGAHRVRTVAGPLGNPGRGTPWAGNPVCGLGSSVWIPCPGGGCRARPATVCGCTVDTGRRHRSLVPGGIRHTSGFPSP